MTKTPSGEFADPGASAPVVDPGQATFFGHPRGLSTLFFTEMWERFSYYGLRAILILFMTASVAEGGLGFEVPRAAAIVGIYFPATRFLADFGGTSKRIAAAA